MEEKQEKAAYFAQYWNQPVQTYKLSYSWKRNVEVSGSSQGFITLTLLSIITDEDAIELVGMLDISLGDNFTDEYDSLQDFKDSLDFKACYPAGFFDFLRSKGYALPFRNYSVEQLIEMGWLKLSTP